METLVEEKVGVMEQEGWMGLGAEIWLSCR